MIRRSAGSLLVLLAVASIARADFHDWRFSELFSDASGNVQFIEFSNVLENGEHFLTGHVLSSGQGSITFSSDLPSDQTLNKTFIVGTDAFAALPGAPTPDYIIPPNFFKPTGDSFNYAGVDTFSFGPGELPTDGVNSLNRDLSTSTNSPTNFAGETGSVRVGGGPTSGIPLPPAAIPGGIMIVLSCLCMPAIKQRLLERTCKLARLHQR